MIKYRKMLTDAAQEVAPNPPVLGVNAPRTRRSGRNTTLNPNTIEVLQALEEELTPTENHTNMSVETEYSNYVNLGTVTTKKEMKSFTILSFWQVNLAH